MPNKIHADDDKPDRVVDHVGFLLRQPNNIAGREDNETKPSSSPASSSLEDITVRNSKDEEVGLPLTPPNKLEQEPDDSTTTFLKKKSLIIVVLVILSLAFLAIGLSVGLTTRGKEKDTEPSPADSTKEYSTVTTSPTEPIHNLPIYTRCNKDSDCLHDESLCLSSSNEMCSDPPCGYCVMNDERTVSPTPRPSTYSNIKTEQSGSLATSTAPSNILTWIPSLNPTVGKPPPPPPPKTASTATSTSTITSITTVTPANTTTTATAADTTPMMNNQADSTTPTNPADTTTTTTTTTESTSTNPASTTTATSSTTTTTTTETTTVFTDTTTTSADPTSTASDASTTTISTTTTTGPTRTSTAPPSFVLQTTPNQSQVTPSFVAGEISATNYKLGIQMSTGLKVKLIAKTGDTVKYASGNDSALSFHAKMDMAGVIPLPSGYVYTSNSEVKNGLGGVFGLYFNHDGDITDYKQLLNGTSKNCGGGVTPWNTWVSCEEVENGQCWQIDPDPFGEHHNSPNQTSLGGIIGGSFESVAIDNTKPWRPVFFVTEDKGSGAIRRVQVINRGWDSLHHNVGSTSYLNLIDEENFEWTTSEDVGRESAGERYQNSEGILYHDEKLYFTAKHDKNLFILDLQNMTYMKEHTGSNIVATGSFEEEPDQILLGKNGKYIYFCEEGGDHPGVHARDFNGTYHTIFRGFLHGKFSDDETVGLALSPDGRRLYAGFQEAGLLMEFSREDGLAFD